MNSNKKTTGQTHQVKPVIAQLKSLPLAQGANQSSAIQTRRLATQRSLPTPKVLQTKTVISSKSSAETHPVVPPTYHPQAPPRVLQTKRTAARMLVTPTRGELVAQPKLRNHFHPSASNSHCRGCRTQDSAFSSLTPARALPIVVQLAAKAKAKAKEEPEAKVDPCEQIRKLIALFSEETPNEFADKNHIAMHDQLLGAGKHHGKRNVTYKQLIGDLETQLQRRNC
jgi:hypothetical protein